MAGFIAIKPKQDGWHKLCVEVDATGLYREITDVSPKIFKEMVEKLAYIHQ